MNGHRGFLVSLKKALKFNKALNGVAALRSGLRFDLPDEFRLVNNDFHNCVKIGLLRGAFPLVCIRKMRPPARFLGVF